MAPEAAVVARGLTKRFGDMIAVNGINLEIHRGEVYGFLGPNGAGKTTTIRMLCGIMDPTAGEARVLGFDVRSQREALKARIGYMSQRASLYADLTVVEQLRFYARIYGLDTSAAHEKVGSWIESSGLAGRDRDLVSTLSGGWRQRLALGCAVMHHPDLLLLDEPTSGVDPLSRRQFWDLIYRFADEGTTVMVTTHYMDEAEHCDRLAFIYGGRIVAEGAPEEIKRRHMPGLLIRVVCREWMRAFDFLRLSPRVRSAALYGTAIHVLVSRAEGAGEAQGAAQAQAVDALARDLADAGIQVDAIAPIAPSLEDIFVSLTGDASGGGPDG
ncbi:MAG: ABC transporter ATP-binding protein [Armatimonadetes bacterium]|nr:ABC transporter ATP-binding protein [Armatimonadota bacterium]